MYVYVNRKIDKIMTIASQRGKINLKGENGEESSASAGVFGRKVG
jgi:hypothetical protein